MPIVRFADQSAVVAARGAALRAYDVGGRPVVETFGDPDGPAVGCAGEVLAPWPNRVVDGQWTWRGRSYALPVNETDLGHALHGLVRDVDWRVTAETGDRVELAVSLGPSPGWPFPMDFSVSYALGPGGVVSTLTATNAGDEPCPYGAAVHPYLAVPGGPVDEVVLDLPAATWLETDERLVPVGRRETAGSPYAFAAAAPIGARRADTAYTDLPRLPDGRVEARMTAPDGRTTVMWGDGAVRWWQLFTGDALAEPWTRRTIALEPMTCPPDALNTGEDLVVLEPGGTHSMTWGLRLALAS